MTNRRRSKCQEKDSADETAGPGSNRGGAAQTPPEARISELPRWITGSLNYCQYVGVLYFVGAVVSGLAPNVSTFIIACVIGGLGIGISTVAAPLYISEIAPPKYRARLAGMFQFTIVFGILIAYVSNALLAGVGDNAWRWMLGVAAFPLRLARSEDCLARCCPPRCNGETGSIRSMS